MKNKNVNYVNKDKYVQKVPRCKLWAVENCCLCTQAEHKFYNIVCMHLDILKINSLHSIVVLNYKLRVVCSKVYILCRIKNP